MDLTDEKLGTNITVETRMYEEQPIQATTVVPLNHETNRLVADWIVGGFCRICPHREA